MKIIRNLKRILVRNLEINFIEESSFSKLFIDNLIDEFNEESIESIFMRERLELPVNKMIKSIFNFLLILMRNSKI